MRDDESKAITPRNIKTQSDILDKVRKLLRLADRSRGSTENEAKVALAKAQELMTRHNIDSALFRMEHGEAACGFNVNKASYYRGLRDGINAELTAAKQRAENAYTEGQMGSYAIMLVDQKAVVTRYVEDNYGKLRTRTQRNRRVDSHSYVAGKNKGHTIRINRPLPQ